jgi:hypothetical protein
MRRALAVVVSRACGMRADRSPANKWTRGHDLPTSRHGLGVVASGSTLYVMSGGPTQG